MSEKIKKAIDTIAKNRNAKGKIIKKPPPAKKAFAGRNLKFSENLEDKTGLRLQNRQADEPFDPKSNNQNRKIKKKV